MAFVDNSKNLSSEDSWFKKSQNSLKERFLNIANDIKAFQGQFYEVEKKCFKEDRGQCLAQHDQFKLLIADLQRKQEKEKQKCFKTCQALIPKENNRKQANWESDYFECYSLYMERYINLMQNECEIYKNAASQLLEN
ncbi:unnamed protein product [Blepharisma stoltei]|uniref:Uncharacterized protein n=1 Tax=Blepharisma stoltei TaxID=1481888 RepID=A0AAU9JPN4_9CILI|nr:unnamed protein product [Blepharisma stoltei]